MARNGRTVYDDNLLTISEDGVIYGRDELLSADIPATSLIVFYSHFAMRNTYAVVMETTIETFLTDYGFTIVVGEIPLAGNYLQLKEQITKNIKKYWDTGKEIRAFASPFQGKLSCFLVTRGGKYLSVVVYNDMQVMIES